MAMLDDNPVLKERLMACGAFGGIALFAVAAVNLLISGGFDFDAARADYNRPQPSAYVRMVDAANYVGDRFQSISWDEPTSIGGTEASNSEDLVGANDGSPAPLEAGSGEDLYQQIASLYERDVPQTNEPAYEDMQASDAETIYEADEEPVYDDQSEAEADKFASAYENESPW
jgi:hypothetical protein